MNAPALSALPTLTTLPEAVDPLQYCIESPAEILAILRRLAGRNTLVTVGFGEDGGLMVTTLLEVNAQSGELVLDGTADAQALERLTGARFITVETMLDSIRIAFATGSATMVEGGAFSAFRVPVPEVLVRLQRRDAFRIAAPVAQPLRCRVSLPSDPDRPVMLRVSDLSVGGLSLTVDGLETDIAPGATLTNCHLELPETGTVRGNIEVVHVLSRGDDSGRRRVLGCRFAGLPGSSETLLQRYITRLERTRRALA
jgi:c-di-GMP-binding flagellar brake protein YcgR